MKTSIFFKIKVNLRQTQNVIKLGLKCLQNTQILRTFQEFYNELL